MPFTTFANNHLLTAEDVNTYLARQVVIRVANAAEQAAIPAPDVGMVVFRQDKGWCETYNGTGWGPAWVDLPGSNPWAPVAVATVQVPRVALDPASGLVFAQGGVVARPTALTVGAGSAHTPMALPGGALQAWWPAKDVYVTGFMHGNSATPTPCEVVVNSTTGGLDFYPSTAVTLAAGGGVNNSARLCSTSWIPRG